MTLKECMHLAETISKEELPKDYKITLTAETYMMLIEELAAAKVDVEMLVDALTLVDEKKMSGLKAVKLAKARQLAKNLSTMLVKLLTQEDNEEKEEKKDVN